MYKPIRRVGVIGAGVMGSGIAAHLANAGVEVAPPRHRPAEPHGRREEGNRAARNRFAAGGLEKALKARPAAFFHKAQRAPRRRSATSRTTSRSSPDCDLVIEAIIEQIEPKRALFEKLEKIVPGARIVASNTSGLRIADMMQGPLASASSKRFLVMHFFNPVRYMKLLELVAGPETRPRRRRARRAASARTCSARASSSARTRRTSSATASARTR